MEIWNAKFGGNMYSNFEEKCGALPKVYFRQAIYLFKALEVRNPTLQIVCKLELKQRRYDRLKITL